MPGLKGVRSRGEGSVPLFCIANRPPIPKWEAVQIWLLISGSSFAGLVGIDGNMAEKESGKTKAKTHGSFPWPKGFSS